MSGSSIPLLRKGQHAMLHAGDVYYVKEWSEFCNPADGRHWYWNESRSSWSWDFPSADAALAISKWSLPPGWAVYRDPADESIWWWNEASGTAQRCHPSGTDIRTLGVFKSATVKWDFNILQQKQCDGLVNNMCEIVSKLLRSPTLEDGLLYCICGPTKEVKNFSNTGTVKVMGQEREVYLGNWTYSVLLKRTKVKRAKTDVAADETVGSVVTDPYGGEADVWAELFCCLGDKTQ